MSISQKVILGAEKKAATHLIFITLSVMLATKNDGI
jgi:hypothetical protein